MGKDRRGFSERYRDNKITANLMALNGADPVTVYKEETSSHHSLGISLIIVGGFMAFIIPIIGVPAALLGLAIIIKRRKTIQELKKQMAEQQKNAASNERAALKEEVRREMLKEELRAEIEAEKAAKKVSSSKKASTKSQKKRN